MDTSVKFEKTTEKFSLWDAIKSFFADSVDESEIDEEKIKEIEKQQDNKHIEALEKYISKKKKKKGKSKSKSNLKLNSKIAEQSTDISHKANNLNKNDKHKERD